MLRFLCDQLVSWKIVDSSWELIFTVCFKIRSFYSCFIIITCFSLWPITFLENWFKLIFKICLNEGFVRFVIVIHSKFICQRGLYDYNATTCKLIFIRTWNDRMIQCPEKKRVLLKHMHRVTIIIRMKLVCCRDKCDCPSLKLVWLNSR